MIDFTETMKEKTNRELISITTEFKHDYQKEAVLAAEKEIQKRNLSKDQIEEAKREQKIVEDIEINKQQESLQLKYKLLFLLFCWGILPWAMAGTYKNNGYKKKYKDAWRFMKIGIAIYLSLFLILYIILISI